WPLFKSRFCERRVVQFTATPFREDKRPIDGKIIFRYPLRLAQKEGYFRPIDFCPVFDFDRRKGDIAIAEAAVARLRADHDKGHIVMARVESVARAAEVLPLYARYGEYNAIELHSGVIPAAERERRKQLLISGQSRIVVCVDMLGEGFDLPELKIAAFHDIRKSLSVTLQLAGRFTRSRADLGNATFIANTADIQVGEELRALYTQDPDWNILLPELSDNLIEDQVSLREFLAGFGDLVNEIPVGSIRPATSTVVYRTTCAQWTPLAFERAIPSLNSCDHAYHSINESQKTLVVVTARRASVPWTDSEALYTLDWSLYVIFWSESQGLLFINSSGNAGEYGSLASAVGGAGCTLLSGETVFRAFSGVARLHLQNVGLTEQLGRNVRYTGRMGSDVESGLSGTQRMRARKSVISGVGFEGRRKVAIGASRKGRIWSHRRGRLDELLRWCVNVGEKLLDESVDPELVLKGTLETCHVAARPEKVPIAVDWPEEIYTTPESRWLLTIDGIDQGLELVSLQLEAHEAHGPLVFCICTDTAKHRVTLELLHEHGALFFRFRSDGAIAIRKDGSTAHDVASFFDEHPPCIWFADGSSLEGNAFVELKGTTLLFPADAIVVLDWAGIDLRKEAQGPEKRTDTIQSRVIETLQSGSYDVIIDDDGCGEAADIVAIRQSQLPSGLPLLEIEFYHCKYSMADRPGARIGDLYEVCGQAQKSVSWMGTDMRRVDLFTHLLRRASASAPSRNRYERGDQELLRAMRDMSYRCETRFSVFIAQPGLSKEEISDAQKLLLGVTQTYLFETYQVRFGVMASA
ncbi:MAG: restriction endonuclease subunit R, partial [Verrucomicrobiaceae bacterium]